MAIQAFRELQAHGVIRAFVLGGASALVFYTEPDKDRERARLLWQQASLGENKLIDILTRHGLIERWNQFRSQM